MHEQREYKLINQIAIVTTATARAAYTPTSTDDKKEKRKENYA